MDHEWRRENVAKVPADGEFAILAVAGQARDPHGAHHDRQRQFGRIDLEHDDGVLEVQCAERIRIVGVRLKPFATPAIISRSVVSETLPW